MAYTPNTWQSREGAGLNRFQDQDGNIYYFTAVPEQVTQPGTPFSADRMNHIEQGVAANSEDVETAQSDISTLQSNVSQAQSNISTLQSNVSQAQSNISTLQTNMSQAQSNISNLQNNFPVSIANGGTGATSAEQARENLGVSVANNPLFTPSPTYNSSSDSTETNFNAWLDDILINDMPSRQVRIIIYSCYPAISGGSCLGFLYGHDFVNHNTAVLLSFSTQNQLFIKQKAGGTWQNTQKIFP